MRRRRRKRRGAGEVKYIKHYKVLHLGWPLQVLISLVEYPLKLILRIQKENVTTHYQAGLSGLLTFFGATGLWLVGLRLRVCAPVCSDTTSIFISRGGGKGGGVMPPFCLCYTRARFIRFPLGVAAGCLFNIWIRRFVLRTARDWLG